MPSLIKKPLKRVKWLIFALMPGSDSFYGSRTVISERYMNTSCVHAIRNTL